jgi:hypothetical protein
MVRSHQPAVPFRQLSNLIRGENKLATAGSETGSRSGRTK